MQTNDSDETSDQVAACVARLATDAFAHHEVKSIRPGEWLCKRPGTGAYHYFVIALPGVLVVYGDLGEWILRMADSDPVAWARAAVRSPGYFFEKVCAASDGGRDAFYPADVKQWLERSASEEDGDRCARALEALRDREEEWDCLTHEMATEVLADHGFDDFYRMGVAPSARSHWLLEAIRWFTEHVGEAETPSADGATSERMGGAA